MRPAGSAVRSRPIERPSFLILSLNDVRPAHPPDPLLQASSADDEGQTLNSTCPPRTECDTVYGNSLPSLPTLYWNDVGSQTWLRQTSSPRHVALSFLDDESAPARFATEATSATTHAFLALLRLLLIIMMSKEDRSTRGCDSASEGGSGRGHVEDLKSWKPRGSENGLRTRPKAQEWIFSIPLLLRGNTDPRRATHRDLLDGSRKCRSVRETTQCRT